MLCQLNCSSVNRQYDNFFLFAEHKIRNMDVVSLKFVYLLYTCISGYAYTTTMY